MKTYLITCLILFATLVSAQVEMKPVDVSTGIFVQDSLYTAWIDTAKTPDDTLSAVSYKTLDLSFSYETMNITVQDTGATYDDSLKIEWGEIKYEKGIGSRAYTPTDTVWHPIPYIRDTTWTIATQPFVDDNSVHSYFIYCSSYYIIRIIRVNVQAVFNRATYFYIQAAKKIY